MVEEMTKPKQEIKFVSRCPANFEKKLESRMIHKAYESNKWEEVGSFHKGKKASIYRGQEFIEEVCGRAMRMIVLRSSSLEEKAETALKKEEEKIRPLIRELEKKTFACTADIEKEKERFCALDLPANQIKSNKKPKYHVGDNSMTKIDNNERIDKLQAKQ